ncbi:unnamed protein product [Thelazia callipaeda]|uniref:BZIP domain-containing protein n=1 Tax=Thelazia callipaeda TaxID=103827 RepID=A0A0N5CWI5_THECL|nr:unnamed protein product [Thelazia callipaeda]
MDFTAPATPLAGSSGDNKNDAVGPAMMTGMMVSEVMDHNNDAYSTRCRMSREREGRRRKKRRISRMAKKRKGNSLQNEFETKRKNAVWSYSQNTKVREETGG